MLFPNLDFLTLCVLPPRDLDLDLRILAERDLDLDLRALTERLLDFSDFIYFVTLNYILCIFNFGGNGGKRVLASQTSVFKVWGNVGNTFIKLC